ncbi:MAG: lipopolysaccharide kinase InaA family protein [Planctomycetota bacterium]
MKANGLADFQALWEAPLEPVDMPNEDRGGWSQVFFLTLKADDGSVRKAIVKRQYGHLTRTPLHLIKGIPTFRREFHNIQCCADKDINSMTTVFYAERKIKGRHHAILVTEFLDGYIQLDKLGLQWKAKRLGNQTQRRAVIAASAALVKKLHAHQICHGHLYPKHIMVKLSGDEVDARLIDLEGMRYIPVSKRHLIKDLSVLNRRNQHWPNTDKLRFILAYLGKEKLDKNAKRFCMKIFNRKKKKKTSFK